MRVHASAWAICVVNVDVAVVDDNYNFVCVLFCFVGKPWMAKVWKVENCFVQSTTEGVCACVCVH